MARDGLTQGRGRVLAALGLAALLALVAPQAAGATTVPGVAIAEPSAGTTDLVSVTSSGALDFSSEAAGTSDWTETQIAGGGSAALTPAMLVRPSGEVDVFVTTPSGSIEEYFSTAPTAAGSWTPLAVDGAGSALFAPAAGLRSNGEEDVVAVGPGNSLQFYSQNAGGGPWGKSPAIAGSGSGYSAPALVYRSNNDADVLVQGPNNTLQFYGNTYQTNGWVTQQVAGAGTTFSAPAALVRPGDEIDVVAEGSSDSLQYDFILPGTSTWNSESIAGAGTAYSNPAVILQPNADIDAVVDGPNGSLNSYSNVVSQTSWTASTIAPSNQAADPAAAISGNQIEVSNSSDEGVPSLFTTTGGNGGTLSWTAQQAIPSPAGSSSSGTGVSPAPVSQVITPPAKKKTTTRSAPQIRATFKVSWHFRARTTWLESFRIVAFPSRATLKLTCGGHGCPWRDRLATARTLPALERKLKNTRFAAGDRIAVEISAKGERAEVLRISVADGRLPTYKAVAG